MRLLLLIKKEKFYNPFEYSVLTVPFTGMTSTCPNNNESTELRSLGKIR